MSRAAQLRLPNLSIGTWVGIGVFAAAAAAAFWPTFRWMAERFDAHDSFYSHGWLVPLASGWLIWRRRQLLASLPGRGGSYWGLAILVPSLCLEVIASWWRVGVLSGVAMLGAFWGLVWTCWGWRVLWALRFPMLFLLFMVPLPGVLLISASFNMKMAAASLATGFLKIVGIPAVQAGSTIHVPGVSVIVDDTCSGLRSLISLIALATLWIELMPSAMRWQRAAVVVASIPIALVANMARILVLVLLSAIYGPKIGESVLHYGSGIVVFGVALMALAWFSQAVQRWSGSFALNRSPSSP